MKGKNQSILAQIRIIIVRENNGITESKECLAVLRSTPLYSEFKSCWEQLGLSYFETTETNVSHVLVYMRDFIS